MKPIYAVAAILIVSGIAVGLSMLSYVPKFEYGVYTENGTEKLVIGPQILFLSSNSYLELIPFTNQDVTLNFTKRFPGRKGGLSGRRGLPRQGRGRSPVLP